MNDGRQIQPQMCPTLNLRPQNFATRLTRAYRETDYAYKIQRTRADINGS